MKAFGDRRADTITSRDVSRFLQQLDGEGLSGRNVNKHRQVLAAIFAYGCRPDTFDLADNPATTTDKRREDPPPALDYYEVEEVEALARACAAGEHRATKPAETPTKSRPAPQKIGRTPTPSGCSSTRASAWARCSRCDGKTSTSPTGYFSFDADSPQARRHSLKVGDTDLFRYLTPLSPRWLVSDRSDFTSPEDYVLASRLGRRLDGSALRRRYKRGCAAAQLRPVRLHGLRHAAGSLLARTSDPVFVRDFLGHAKLTTTDRYLSAKLRPRELERAFAPSSDLTAAEQPETSP